MLRDANKTYLNGIVSQKNVLKIKQHFSFHFLFFLKSYYFKKIRRSSGLEKKIPLAALNQNSLVQTKTTLSGFFRA